MEFVLGIFGVLYLCSPVFVWALVHWHWRKLGKDPVAAHPTIIPQYEAFQNLPPALIGVVYDTRANDYDITATLLDFVARKIIQIENHSKVEERWNGKIQIYHTVDYQLTLLQTNTLTDTELRPYEQLIIKAVFASDTTCNLATAIQRLQNNLRPIRQQLYHDAVTAGLFTVAADLWRQRYDVTSRWLIGIGFVTGLFGVGVPVLLYGIVLRIYSRWMAQRTALGIEAVQWCEGFKLYLYRAERFHTQRMALETAEKILPYIIVLHLQIPAWQLEFSTGTGALAHTKI